ncbi:MAG: type IV pilus twitching motility protein PilT [Bacillota bacterium]|jgi:twitching motility protein PilT
MTAIHELLATAVKLKASDIHITVGLPPVIKTGAEFKKLGDKSLTPSAAEKLIRDLFPKETLYHEFQAEGDKDFSLSVPGLSRFRVNAFKQRGSVAAVVRVIPFQLPNPEELGIPKAVRNLSTLTNGLVLVTGPAASGKSTTLAAIIDLINETRECHILTLEDPIEYLHTHKKSIVNQREIGIDAQCYARALRAAMRESPDVILLGEMRDLETTSIALTAAETGQLVFSTLHTIGAPKTIDRIIDVFPPNQQHQIRIQLSTVLQAVVSQQLIPSTRGDRVPAFEILRVNDAVRNLIRENKTPLISSVIQTSRPDGMTTMDNSILNLFRNGLITRENALLYSVDKKALARQIA